MIVTCSSDLRLSMEELIVMIWVGRDLIYML